MRKRLPLLLEPGEARQLSYELRRWTGPHMARRRGVIALTLLSMGSIGLVALYQSGLIRRLPDLPGRRWAADRVDAVPDAYRAGMGDAFLALGSYAVTACLAAAGGKRRSKTHPWLPLALLTKTLTDAFIAGKLTEYQWRECRAFCIWCLLTTATTTATVPLALPEAVDAWQHCRNGRRRRRR